MAASAQYSSARDEQTICSTGKELERVLKELTKFAELASEIKAKCAHVAKNTKCGDAKTELMKS